MADAGTDQPSNFSGSWWSAVIHRTVPEDEKVRGILRQHKQRRDLALIGRRNEFVFAQFCYIRARLLYLSMNLLNRLSFSS